MPITAVRMKDESTIRACREVPTLLSAIENRKQRAERQLTFYQSAANEEDDEFPCDNIFKSACVKG